MERKPRKPQPKREIVTIFTTYSPVENTHNCIAFVSQSSQDKLMTMVIHFLGRGRGEGGGGRGEGEGGQNKVCYGRCTKDMKGEDGKK